jgi:hypothetical protein
MPEARAHALHARGRQAVLKDLTLATVVGVLALALAIGLVFRWLYPLVDLTAELAGLFVLVALALKLLLGRLWGLLHKPQAPTDVGAGK